MSLQVSAISAGMSSRTPEYLIKQIMALGGTPSGDYTQDMQILTRLQKQNAYKTQQAQANQQTQQTQKEDKTEESSKPELPWQDLLDKLGISSQGSKEADISAISSRIDQLEATAKTDAEKANVKSLRSELQAAASVSTNMGGAAPVQNEFQGAEQVSKENKYFMGIQ